MHALYTAMPGREKQTLASTNQMRVHIASSTYAYNPVLISRASRVEIRRVAAAVDAICMGY